MSIGAALSTDPDPANATAAAVKEARSRLGEAEVSLAVLVVSRHYAASADVASEAVRVARPQRVIGCVAETVVGGDREVEDGPAVAVWLASLPEPVETFHMEFVRTSEGGVLGGYRFEEAGPGAYLIIGTLRLVEIAELLGVSEQRAHQIAGERGFPAPVGRYSRGRLWDRREVAA